MLVGAVCCRRDGARLYIMTLGVLPSYQRRGVGEKLLRHVFEQFVLAKPRAPADAVADVFLHVQISNDAGLAFYQKHGFVRGERVDGYYKTVTPDAAYLLSCTPAQWLAAHPAAAASSAK